MRFSGFWTAVIVAQVAVTVAFPASAFFFQRWVGAWRGLDLGFPSKEYLTARVVLDREEGIASDASGSQSPAYGTLVEELVRRMGAESGVMAVTQTTTLPGSQNRTFFEVDGIFPDSEDAPPLATGFAAVAPDYFESLGASVLSGRGLVPADGQVPDGPVLVNLAFVEEVLDGRNPIGRLIRTREAEGRPAGPWREIVGVVPNLGMVSVSEGSAPVRLGPGVYGAFSSDEMLRNLLLRVRGDVSALAPRLRQLSVDVDPRLRLDRVIMMDQAMERWWLESRYASRLSLLMSAIALVLSLVAIYSVTAFIVARRTREIGVRIALGARPLPIIRALFRRPLLQVSVGIALGGVLVALISWGLFVQVPTLGEMGLIAVYATVMLGICLLACVVPTRRALRVEPVHALRAEG